MSITVGYLNPASGLIEALGVHENVRQQLNLQSGQLVTKTQCKEILHLNALQITETPNERQSNE